MVAPIWLLARAVIRFGGSTENPLVGAIKKQNLDLRKGIGKRSLLIISVMKILSRSHLKPNVCLITDDEARAVQRLIIDILDGCTSEAMLDWMDAIIERYFNQKSWTQLVTPERTAMDAKYDVRCGLAALHNRYQFIRYKNGSV